MVERKLQLVDWLDDLCVRFIINLPREELESVERICFQVEEAQWFYEDFIRPQDPTLPSLNLRQFCLKIFQHCPLFAGYGDDVFSAAFSEFLAYKTRVPVRGAIMLNDAMDEAVLVKGWKKGSSWSFPRGKINKDEKDIDCAIREVYEETGYDIRGAGLVKNDNDVKSIEITMREQHMKLFVFPGVPKDTHFEPRTRKEISKIEWYKLSDLPALKKGKQQPNQELELSTNASRFYMVAPFMGPLKRYIGQLKKPGTKVKTTAQAPVEQESVASVLAVPVIASGSPAPASLAPPIAPMEAIPTNDMSRLMTQLRQSQQAARENNFPEVTVSTEPLRDASQQLKNILNLPILTAPQVISQQDDVAQRESKAQAIMSLLRGPIQPAPPRKESVELPPETPFDQITANPLIPPPSPKQHPHRVARAPIYPTPTTFPFSSPAPAAHQPRPGYNNQPTIPGPLLHPQPPLQSLSQPMQLQSDRRIPAWRHDEGKIQTGQFLDGDRQVTSAPEANRLPLPKLNAHSSKLLDLFKQGPTSPRIPQLPAEPPRPELSASRPATGGLSQVPFSRPIGDNIRTSYALASNATGSSLRSGQKTPSQQETLLSLFKGSALTNKPSPSLASPLAPPPAPVELSANPESTRIDTTRVDAAPQSPKEARASVRNISPLTEDEKPFTLPLNGGPDLSPDLSATVTGPLGEMHFDSLKSPDNRKRAKIHQSPKHLSPKRAPRSNPKGVPLQQFRILPRPVSSNADQPVQSSGQNSSINQPRIVERVKDMRDSQAAKVPFQPQILKRPAVVAPIAQDMPAPTPKIFPQILSRSTEFDTSEFGQKTSLDGRKASLLALFGSKTSETPVMSSSALPVSPLSERPAPESALPSPMGVSRPSRFGSIQGMASGFDGPSYSGPSSLAGSGKSTPRPGVISAPAAAAAAAAAAPAPVPAPAPAPRAGLSSVASPVDRNFLLGFLDGVVKEGAR